LALPDWGGDAVVDDEVVDAILLPSDSLGSLTMNTHAPWLGGGHWRDVRLARPTLEF
jgi:hypothetical protein